MFKMKNSILFCVLMLLCSCSSARVREYKIKVLNEYPHDSKAYTQGLFFYDGKLCESTGEFGSSSYREVELKTGKIIRKIDFAAKYFGEGSCVLGGNLFFLTWTNKVAFVYDPKTLKYIKAFSYPREGWGLTTDGRNLIASDGSNRLYFMDESFRILRTLNVLLDGRPVRYLNELEWVDGKIWANVYTTDMILIIDPESGEVEAKVDCNGLLPSKLRTPDTDVLNGIARNPETGDIFLTGKNWPRIYQIALTDK